MEASKCPKCGEEPHFVEAVEKWYCYGCNEYIEDGEAAEAETEAEVADEGKVEICKKCGAELESVTDGKLYCYICGAYPEEAPAAAPAEAPTAALTEVPVAVPATPIKDEVQALLDSIPSPVISTEGVSPIAPPEAQVEPKVEKAPEIKMCLTCGQPMKWIDKYQRDYCYGCRKYAPKDVPAPEPEPAPAPALVVEDRKTCPECKGDLKFIEKYNEYYCHSCKKYPLRGKKAAHAERKADGCPKCGKPLSHIAKYDRDYCHSCKEYAPKSASGSGQERKMCPSCNSAMKYVSEYNEWYCYKCKKYSLRPSKPVLLF